MWKKSDEETSYSTPEPQPATTPRGGRQEQATIGPSIKIDGNLSGEEDLVIQGHVDGEIRLPKNKVTIGSSGRVKADIYGKSIRVDGQVKGNLYGDEDVVVRASGRVQGNIVGPRVTLENGANFKGSIDMEPTGTNKAKETKEAKEAKPIEHGAGAPKSPKPEQAELNTAAGRG